MNLRLRNRCRRCGAFLAVEEPPVKQTGFWAGFFDPRIVALSYLGTLANVVYAAWHYFR